MMKNEDIKGMNWKVVEKDYKIIRFLGSGSYGHVIEADHIITHKKVAIKRVNSLFEDLIDTKRILREITLLRFMKNPFVVELLDIIYDTKDPNFDTIFLIFEYAPSDLKKIIKSNLYLGMIDVKLLVYHILCGLKYIHSCNVLHRDLKPGNILLHDDYHTKICDFGLARSVIKDEEEVIENKENTNNETVNENNEKEKNITEVKPPIDKAKLFGRKKDNTEINNNTVNVTTEETIKVVSDTEKKSSTVKKPVMLGQMKKQNQKAQKNLLSVHVVTRWYRAPEVILIEKNYSSAIDIWSVGCIFAELMMMIRENAATFVDRTPLFPGKFCFPLSPPNKNQIKIQMNEKGFPNDKSEQLNVIFDVIGTPSEDDMSFVTDQNAILYLKSIKCRSKIDLKTRFPGSSDDGLDLLSQMLQFNPEKRITVNKAIEHSFFTEVRSNSKEIEAEFSLELSFEKDENLSMEKLRLLFISVIKSYKVNIEI